MSKANEASRVKVDGEDAALHITDQSVMFEKGGKVSGFERSAIRMVKPDKDAMIIAYSVGSEVKSVRVEPMTAVGSLIVPSPASSKGSPSGSAPMAATALDEVFERLYKDAREELEAKLAKIEERPEDKSLRLSAEEEKGLGEVTKQMVNIVGAKHGFDPLADGNLVSLWGLENQPYDVQLDIIKIYHVRFLRRITGPRAETADVIISSEEVWPEDWERLLVKFKLSEGPFIADKYKRYLWSHWKYRPSTKKPALVRS